MECNKFVEEKIGETDSAAFREHRASCAACGHDLEELDEVRRVYREASVERYSGRMPRLRALPRLSWAMAAAAAMMIAALVVLLGAPVRTPVEPTAGKSAVSYTGGIFFRAYLEPWGGREEARLTHEMDDLWRRLDTLERSDR
jgi:hypothetical protein